MGEITFLFILILGLIYLYVLTGSFPTNMLDNTGGAAMFPRFVIVLLGILLIVRIIQIIRLKQINEHFVFRELFAGSTGVFMLLIVLYVLMFSVLGYIVSTILFAITAVTYCYYKKTGNVGTVKQVIIRILISSIGTLLLYWFFSDILTVRMPHGFLD